MLERRHDIRHYDVHAHPDLQQGNSWAQGLAVPGPRDPDCNEDMGYDSEFHPGPTLYGILEQDQDLYAYMDPHPGATQAPALQGQFEFLEVRRSRKATVTRQEYKRLRRNPDRLSEYLTRRADEILRAAGADPHILQPDSAPLVFTQVDVPIKYTPRGPKFQVHKDGEPYQVVVASTYTQEWEVVDEVSALYGEVVFRQPPKKSDQSLEDLSFQAIQALRLHQSPARRQA